MKFFRFFRIKSLGFCWFIYKSIIKNEKAIIKHHSNNPSLTRNDKIIIYYSWLNKKKISSKILNKLLIEFANNISNKILNI